MSTNIIKTNGEVLISIANGTIDDTSSSITLVGRNVLGYGTYIESSIVHIMENFCNTSAPNAPLKGQIWFNSDRSRLCYYNNTWIDILDQTDKDLFDSEIAAINNHLTLIDGEINTINGEITNINNHLSQLDGEINTINGEITTINNHLTQLDGEISSINNHLSVIDGEISTLQGDITTINNHLGTLDGEVNTLQGDISTINNTISNIQGETQNIPKNLSDLNDVSVSAITDGQLLTYNSSDAKWENKTYTIPIDPSTDNLLQQTSSGLLVELKAAADVSNQYISSSTGSDTSGDGTKANPFATIRHALNRIADNTSATIWLKAGDTFRIEDGANGYVENGTLSQVLTGQYNLQHKDVTICTYGNDVLDKAMATSGIALSDVEIGTQAILEFTTSYTSDGKQYVTPGFVINNVLYLNQISIVANTANTSALTENTAVNWSGAFAPESGTLRMEGCNYTLNKVGLLGGPGGNASSATVIIYDPRFDVTNGDCLAAGYMGITLKAPFNDNTTSTPILIGDNDSGFKTRINNFNSTCAKLECYYGLSVINSASRTYAGIVTQNKLDN